MQSDPHAQIDVRPGTHPDADPALDQRSMRALELGMAGVAFAVAALLSLAEPAGAQSMLGTDLLAAGAVLFIVALVALVR